MDCSSPDSSVHGTSQARISEWFGISSSRTSLYNLYFNLKLSKFSVRASSQQSLYPGSWTWPSQWQSMCAWHMAQCLTKSGTFDFTQWMNSSLLLALLRIRSSFSSVHSSPGFQQWLPDYCPHLWLCLLSSPLFPYRQEICKENLFLFLPFTFFQWAPIVLRLTC